MALTSADFIQDCRFVPPDQPYIEVPKSLIYTSPQLNLGDIRLNERQPVNCIGIFVCTGILIAMAPSPGGVEPALNAAQNPGIVYIRFRWPNGRFTSNVRVNNNIVFNPYSLVAPGGATVEGVQDRLNKPLRIEPISMLPGQEIGIEVENRASVGQAPIVAVVEFRGKERKFLKNAVA